MENELVIELEEDVLDISINTENENVEVEIEDSDKVPTGATSNYKKLVNKPQIEGVELIDNKTFEDLGLSEISNIQVDELLNKYFNI